MFGLKSHSAISDKLAVKDLSEEAREKIQEYNNNVLFPQGNKKDVSPGNINDVTLSLITTRHICEIVRVPVSYHSHDQYIFMTLLDRRTFCQDITLLLIIKNGSL